MMSMQRVLKEVEKMMSMQRMMEWLAHSGEIYNG
jgi:hypothetical protein